MDNPFFWWGLFIAVLMLAVLVKVRGCAGLLLVLLLLVVMFVPYLNEAKDMPSVRDAWSPNPATYQPESWECDIQRAKHAAQNYPVDPLYRSCFR